jgi:hypothetical protein
MFLRFTQEEYPVSWGDKFHRRAPLLVRAPWIILRFPRSVDGKTGAIPAEVFADDADNWLHAGCERAGESVRCTMDTGLVTRN